ncbi:hornerin isoform X3 [Uranotaenia lowii]|uniref:hornerin isoform X3 n=1 Tax=Uranotaenia lowii TaxID=190385 RepID=UPI002479D6C4|nr:hornerin isoform X3 [Uranotaenia lowii]
MAVRDAVFRKLGTGSAMVAAVMLAAFGSGVSGAALDRGSGGSDSGQSTALASSDSKSSPIIDSLLRITRDDHHRQQSQYGGSGSGGAGRDQRCVSCSGYGGQGVGSGGGGGGASPSSAYYADRDSMMMRTYGRPYGVLGYYSGRGSVYDDRNWYYRPEWYQDERASYRDGTGYGGGGYPGSMRPSYMGVMMGYDDPRYMNRYDDRYNPMSMRGYYDNRMGSGHGGGYYPPMDNRGYGMTMMNGYRGNGYDNLDPQFEYYMMLARGGGPGSNRDRYGASPSGGYGDDRNRGGYGYDHKNFRPWDETYRGTAGFDNSGRGYYFASRPPSAPSQSSSQGQYPGPSSPTSSHHQQQQQSHSQYPQQASQSHYQQPQGHHQYHQQASSGYGSSGSGGGPPTGPAGIYTSQPIGIHQSSGPDRPDAGQRPSCCSQCCQSSSGGGSSSPGRYPSSSGPTGTGPGYHQPSHQGYGGQYGHHQQYQQERPGDHGRPGEWNYLSGGGASSSSAASGSGAGSDYHQASSAAGASSHSQSGGYGSRPGASSDYKDRPDAGGQNGRPRPSQGLGPTSYLMDRDSAEDGQQSALPGIASHLHGDREPTDHEDQNATANGGEKSATSGQNEAPSSGDEKKQP